LVDAKIDSLGLDTAAQNLAYVARDGWQPLYSLIEKKATEMHVRISPLVLYALATHEAGIEFDAESGRFKQHGERVIRSSTGCRGPFAVSSRLLTDYNKSHKDAPYTWNDMFKYGPNFEVATWNLDKSLRERDGDIRLALMDHASGRGTSNQVEKYLRSQDEKNQKDVVTPNVVLIERFWKTYVPPKLNKDRNKSVTPELINQARELSLHVAVLTDRFDEIAKAAGRDPTASLSPQDSVAYRDFQRTGHEFYGLGRQAFETGKNPSPVMDVAELYRDRLIRPNFFDGRYLADMLNPVAQNNP